MQYLNIKQQFTSVINYSQDKFVALRPIYDFTELFQQWERNKQTIRWHTPFFNDNNLIYEYSEPVSISVGLEARKERLERYIKELWDTPLIQQFLSQNKSNFFENRILEDYRAPYGTAKRGMKITKALKFFFKDSKCRPLYKIRNELSSILNEDRIEGTFCVSIHPLDYISISDNDCKWHTCHALNSDYRAGNLNYMADECTIVCYIKSGPDRHIANFPPEVPWNSKKWRVLIYCGCDGNLFLAGKQYPSQSDEALDYFQKAWEEAARKYPRYGQIDAWNKEQINQIHINNLDYYFLNPLIPFGAKMYTVNELYGAGENTVQYNDILYNQAYKKEVRYAYRVKEVNSRFKRVGPDYQGKITMALNSMTKTYEDPPLITAGQAVNCPICGLHIINSGDAFMCDHCMLKYYNHDTLDDEYFPRCVCCNQRIPYYEGIWTEEYGEGIWERDGYVCVECAEEVKSYGC